jgi:hypothetical protein
MTRFMNIMIASVGLATALMPIAANATAMTPLSHAQIEIHKAITGPLPEVQRVAANSYAAVAQSPTGRTIVQSGPVNQMFPESLGG